MGVGKGGWERSSCAIRGILEVCVGGVQAMRALLRGCKHTYDALSSSREPCRVETKTPQAAAEV